MKVLTFLFPSIFRSGTALSKKAVLAAGLCLSISVFSFGELFANNLLANEFFEVGVGTDAENWTQSTTGAGATRVDTVEAASGTWVMRQGDLTSSYSREFISSTFTVIGSTEYHVGGWAMLESDELPSAAGQIFRVR